MKRFIKTIPASQTDSSIVAAVAGKRIRIHQLIVMCGGTATTLVLNSKGAGAGTAITPTFPNGANGGFVLPPSKDEGWFDTGIGEGLTGSTGAGSSTVLMGTYTER